MPELPAPLLFGNDSRFVISEWSEPFLSIFTSYHMIFSQNVQILDLHSLNLLAVDPDARGVG